MKIFLAIVGIVFVAVLAAGLSIVAYDIYRRFSRQVTEKALAEVQAAWKRIIREKDYRHGILEADKLLDHALYLKGYRGNLGTKLKKAHRLFGRDINRVWSAHKVRNNIAHQINFQVDEGVYRASMLAFRDALRAMRFFD